jgi:LAO/AO transport system kinase
VATSSLAPPTGIGELIDALDEHRRGLDLTARRLRARRMHALADFAAEHGERGLRALGGRREAVRFLEEQDPGLDVAGLERMLGERAAG